MGRLFLEHLDGPCYRCRRCQAHLAKASELISKAFHCAHGRAYLFNTAYNVRAGVQEERPMTTGQHVVSDISCVSCAVIVGWVYVEAHEKSQKYKEGKYILEKCRIVDQDGHELGSDTDDA